MKKFCTVHSWMYCNMKIFSVLCRTYFSFSFLCSLWSSLAALRFPNQLYLSICFCWLFFFFFVFFQKISVALTYQENAELPEQKNTCITVSDFLLENQCSRMPISQSSSYILAPDFMSFFWTKCGSIHLREECRFPRARNTCITASVSLLFQKICVAVMYLENAGEDGVPVVLGSGPVLLKDGWKCMW